MMAQETERDGTEGGGQELWDSLQGWVEELGNVSEACRRAGVSRSTYYAWKGKVERDPDTRMEDGREPIRKHPQAISKELESEIIGLAKENPEWGCDRIAYFLKLNRKRVSSPTVQKILIRNGIGKKSQRTKQP